MFAVLAARVRPNAIYPLAVRAQYNDALSVAVFHSLSSVVGSITFSVLRQAFGPFDTFYSYSDCYVLCLQDVCTAAGGEAYGTPLVCVFNLFRSRSNTSCLLHRVHQTHPLLLYLLNDWQFEQPQLRCRSGYLCAEPHQPCSWRRGECVPSAQSHMAQHRLCSLRGQAGLLITHLARRGLLAGVCRLERRPC